MCSHGRQSGSWRSPIHTGHSPEPNLNKTFTTGKYLCWKEEQQGRLWSKGREKKCISTWRSVGQLHLCKFLVYQWLPQMPGEFWDLGFSPVSWWENRHNTLIIVVAYIYYIYIIVHHNNPDQPGQVFLYAPKPAVSASSLPFQCPTIHFPQTERA